MINAVSRTIIGHVNLRNSLCNDPDRNRHFQPRGLAITRDNTQLYVTRFLSFTKAGGKQGVDGGKEGLVCRLNINTAADSIAGYVAGAGDPARTARDRLLRRFQRRRDRRRDRRVPEPAAEHRPARQSRIPAQHRGVAEGTAEVQCRHTSVPEPDHRHRQQHATRSYGHQPASRRARIPEPGKKKLFFSQSLGDGLHQPVGGRQGLCRFIGQRSAGQAQRQLQRHSELHGRRDTTRYIDLNDPANPATSGVNAGKNPLGIVINDAGTRAYTANFVSGNVSIVNLNTDQVIDVVQTANEPDTADHLASVCWSGAEMFFSSRGHFKRPPGTTVSTDDRLSSEGWQNCASCHFDGWTDGVIWQFNSGPRKSVNLAGTFNPRNRAQQKLLNYSAIFDEVEDFEANIRNVSGPGQRGNAARHARTLRPTRASSTATTAS